MRTDLHYPSRPFLAPLLGTIRRRDQVPRAPPRARPRPRVGGQPHEHDRLRGAVRLLALRGCVGVCFEWGSLWAGGWMRRGCQRACVMSGFAACQQTRAPPPPPTTTHHPATITPYTHPHTHISPCSNHAAAPRLGGRAAAPLPQRAGLPLVQSNPGAPRAAALRTSWGLRCWCRARRAAAAPATRASAASIHSGEERHAARRPRTASLCPGPGLSRGGVCPGGCPGCVWRQPSARAAAAPRTSLAQASFK
jgi:hypothetical protein